MVARYPLDCPWWHTWMFLALFLVFLKPCLTLRLEPRAPYSFGRHNDTPYFFLFLFAISIHTPLLFNSAFWKHTHRCIDNMAPAYGRAIGRQHAAESSNTSASIGRRIWYGANPFLGQLNPWHPWPFFSFSLSPPHRIPCFTSG